jgi:hypothetical protein
VKACSATGRLTFAVSRRAIVAPVADATVVGGHERHRQSQGSARGGSMVAKFVSDNPDTGREIFTGTVGK